MQDLRIISAASALCITTLLAQSLLAQGINDQDNFLGDRIRFIVNVKAWQREKPKEELCIPARAQMTVLGIDEKGDKLIIKLLDETKDCNNGLILAPNVAYLIEQGELTRSGAARTGSTYGVLVVPFKYQTTGNKDFTGSATMGGYLGYRYETTHLIGFTLSPIVFLGASNISVPAGTNGQTSSQQLAGFTYGLGLISTFKGAFQAGLVVGWDRVGKSAGYEYNGKPWLAIEIGYAFLQ